MMMSRESHQVGEAMEAEITFLFFFAHVPHEPCYNSKMGSEHSFNIHRRNLTVLNCFICNNQKPILIQNSPNSNE